MKRNKIVIVDYGVGNLYSVWRAIEVLGNTNCKISSSRKDIENADKIILPGVGAFGDGMLGLHKNDLVAPLLNAAKSGKDILGICLGMQMLTTMSEEFGNCDGLNLIPGLVKWIPKFSVDGQKICTPFIGWSEILISKNISSKNSCLKNLDNAAVYLVHYLHVVTSEEKYSIAKYTYGGNFITAAIKKDNITGVQFHPEKSGSVGLSVLKEFVDAKS